MNTTISVLSGVFANQDDIIVRSATKKLYDEHLRLPHE